MKVLVASGPHKGFASASQVGTWIEEGIKRSRPNWKVTVVDPADGGEGTVELLTRLLKANLEKIPSCNPLGQAIVDVTGYAPSTKTAIVEVAATAGAAALKASHWNTLTTSSYGVGATIRELGKRNPRRILIGLGGSIVSDGGLGFAQALGCRFFDAAGRQVLPELRSALSCLDLLRVRHIDLSGIPDFVKAPRYTVLADVSTPLLGPHGQARTFGPQKHASLLDVERIEASLLHWHTVLRDTFHETFDVPSAGAAGGLGAAFKSILGAELRLGIDYVLDQLGFDTLGQENDVIITSEGCLDSTSSLGKICHGIAKRCIRYKMDYYGIFGRIDSLIDEFVDRAIDASASGSGERRFFNPRAIVDASDALARQL